MVQLEQCPICNSAAKFYCHKEEANYFRCQNCESIFQHPLPEVEKMNEYADKQYTDGLYKAYIEARDLKHMTFRKRIRKIKERAKGPRLLDVGCSCGYFLDVALENGFDAYGVEFSGVAIQAAAEQTRPRITQGDVNQLEMQEPFDVITAFDLIEHVSDPLQFLGSFYRLLKPGGLVVVTTPDTHHFLRPLMGKRWPMLQPMQHTRLFSPNSLKLALQETGFNQIELEAAHKVLTPEYLAQQVSIYTPLISNSYKVMSKVLPNKLRNLPISINIGEITAFARREG